MIEDLQIRIINGKPVLYMYAATKHTYIESVTPAGETIVTAQGLNAAWISVPTIEVNDANKT